MHSWRAIVLKEQQKLKMIWDILKAALFVFRLPSQWKRLFTFIAEFASSDLGLEGPDPTVWPGAVAIPMAHL
eukprot:5513021-Amphidinium_carterae.2